MATALLVAGSATTAMAQAFPDASTPIRIVVPYSAGGSSDLIARTFARQMGTEMKHNFIVENKPGGNTVIGADFVARAKPDGYTLYLIGALTHGSLSTLNAKLPFDPLKDFAGISNLVESPLVIDVPKAFPANTLREFVDYAKARPGEINFGSAGTGNTLHLAAEQFSKVTGTKMTHVQYKGAADGVLDLVAGRIQVMFDLPQTQLPHIQSGAVKALAVTSNARLAILPNVPTTAEAGFPGYAFTTKIGLAAPAGTPPAILEQLNAAVRKASADPKLQETFAKQSMLIDTSASPQAFNALLADTQKLVSGLLAGAVPGK